MYFGMYSIYCMEYMVLFRNGKEDRAGILSLRGRELGRRNDNRLSTLLLELTGSWNLRRN